MYFKYSRDVSMEIEIIKILLAEICANTGNYRQRRKSHLSGIAIFAHYY